MGIHVKLKCCIRDLASCQHFRDMFTTKSQSYVVNVDYNISYDCFHFINCSFN